MIFNETNKTETMTAEHSVHAEHAVKGTKLVSAECLQNGVFAQMDAWLEDLEQA